jgi:hypothetical protein
MNLEIKFRVWVPSINKFRNFLFVLDLNGICLEEIGYGETEVNKEAIIQQYTGLVDKNKKEIFEGDIIKFNSGLKYFIDFKNGRWIMTFKDGNSKKINENIVKLFQIEIIGNIFENPDLLK